MHTYIYTYIFFLFPPKLGAYFPLELLRKEVCLISLCDTLSVIWLRGEA